MSTVHVWFCLWQMNISIIGCYLKMGNNVSQYTKPYHVFAIILNICLEKEKLEEGKTRCKVESLCDEINSIWIQIFLNPLSTNKSFECAWQFYGVSTSKIKSYGCFIILYFRTTITKFRKVQNFPFSMWAWFLWPIFTLILLMELLLKQKDRNGMKKWQLLAKTLSANSSN